MTAKEVKFSFEARDKMLRGVDPTNVVRTALQDAASIADR